MTMMPEQVRRQSEAVQKIYEELGDDGETAQQADGQQASPTTQEVPEPTAADSQSNETQQPVGQPEAERPKEDFEQKYRTLQGMYNAEIPRLNAERRELHAKVAQLEQLIAEMPRSAPQPAEQEEPERYVTDSDVDEYGDSIDVMRRVTREENLELRRQLAAMQQQLQSVQALAPRVEQVAQTQTRSTEQAFWSRLSELIPNWRDINENDQFKNWLLDIDPLSGISRQAYLEDAHRNFDVDRVAGFFRTWSQLTGAAQPTQKGRSASQLEQQVSPGRSKSTGAPQQEGEKRTYTTEFIQQFYKDSREGKYKNRKEEKARIEHDLFLAQQEGRIVRA